MCRYAYPQEILIQFFLGITPFFNLEILTKMKDTTETVSKRNSTETAQQNFVNL